MDPLSDQEPDSLATLEERILQAVQLVASLRQEKDAALAQLAAQTAELESLRAEKKKVRTRIEKLLAQIDQLGGA
ncbi:MAG: hypothetical protein HY013_17280 [Candidatus Solibacter usitatus]|nr:hypothetical protein [Candidatus Solibacter usitatus]